MRFPTSAALVACIPMKDRTLLAVSFAALSFAADLVETHAAEVTATGVPGSAGVSRPLTISVRSVG